MQWILNFFAPGDQSLYIEVRHTHWNDMVLARRTCEIIDHCPNSSEFNSLLSQAIHKKSNFEYIQARVDHLRDKRHALEVAGFCSCAVTARYLFHQGYGTR